MKGKKGTVIAGRLRKGDVIMLADDTGKSFHSHLHMHVTMDMSGAVIVPGTAAVQGPGNVGIPFVFREVRGEGRPYAVLDGRMPEQLAIIFSSRDTNLNGWLVVDGGGNVSAARLTVGA